MPDYGLKYNKLEIVSGSIFLYPSASATNPSTAISASVPQILAITCSSNLNNRLIPPNNTSSYSIISFSEGDNAQRLVLRYLSGSYDNNNRIKSVTPTKYLHKSTGARDKYVDIPILNNDDSLTIAYKTVNALQRTGGYNNIFSASLDIIGVDDPSTTGVGSIEIEDNFIIDNYPGGTGLSNYSSSLGVNTTIGSSFRVRAGDGIGDISIGRGFIVGNYETFGSFKIHNFLSGSVGGANFSGSRVQLGGMMVGSSFKMGGNNELFSHNVVQEGSGIQNQPFYEGKVYNNSASLSILIDPIDKISAMITGSNSSASLYFSASGKIGMGTTTPQTDFDIAADKFQVRARRDAKGIFINEEGNIESFNKTTVGAATGSEFIMSYARGGTGQITAALIALVQYGDDQDLADEAISEAGGLAAFINTLAPDRLFEIQTSGEKYGILGTRAQTGDILGSLRWVADSGSFDQRYFDNRGSGEMLKIQGQVVESTDSGIKGDMIFYTTTNVASAPSEIMRIGSNGAVNITGSLNVRGDITYEDVLVQHTTASGDISSSGTIIANKFQINNLSAIYEDNAGGLLIGQGDGLNIRVNSLEASNHITASGNISSSGNVIADYYDAKTSGTGYKLSGAKVVYVDGTKYTFGRDATTVITGSTISLGNPGDSAHVTASGDISASGVIYADAYWVDGKTAVGYSDPKIIFGQTNKTSTLRGDTIELGIAADQHITASGNISSSGNIYSTNHEILTAQSFKIVDLEDGYYGLPGNAGYSSTTWGFQKTDGADGLGASSQHTGIILPYKAILVGVIGQFRANATGNYQFALWTEKVEDGEDDGDTDWTETMITSAVNATATNRIFNFEKLDGTTAFVKGTSIVPSFLNDAGAQSDIFGNYTIIIQRVK